MKDSFGCSAACDVSPSGGRWGLRAVHHMLKVRVRDHGGGKEPVPSQVAVLVLLEQDGATTVSSLARDGRMSSRGYTAKTQKNEVSRGIIRFGTSHFR